MFDELVYVPNLEGKYEDKDQLWVWTDIRCTHNFNSILQEKKVFCTLKNIIASYRWVLVKVMVTQGVPHHHLNFLYIVQILYCQVYIHSPPFSLKLCYERMSTQHEHGWGTWDMMPMIKQPWKNYKIVWENVTSLV